MADTVTQTNGKEQNITFQASQCIRIRRYITKKNVYSVICCSTSFLLGWLFSLCGPPLLELQLNTGVTFTMASTYLTCFNVTHMVGSLVIGFIAYKRVNPFVLIIIGLTVAAVSTLAIPFCHNYVQMMISHGGLGISTGGLDILVIAEMAALWGSTTETPMNALYFASGLGSVLSPVCMTPFLRNLDKFSVLSGKENTTLPTRFSKLSDISSNASQPEVTTTVRTVEQEPLEASSTLYVPYSISTGLACIILLSTLVILIWHIAGKFEVTYIHDSANADEHQVSSKFRYVILLIIGLMSALDSSIEESFGDLSPSFCVKQMEWSSQNSGYIVLVNETAIVVGRIVGLLLQISSLSTIKLMLYYTLLLIVAHVGLVVSGIYSLDYGVWISSFLSGFGVSVLSPCIFNLTEDTFFPVSGKIAAYLVIVSSLGSGLNSLLIGYLMEQVNNMQLAYVLLIHCIIYLILIFICMKLIRLKPTQDKNIQDSRTNETKL